MQIYPLLHLPQYLLIPLKEVSKSVKLKLGNSDFHHKNSLSFHISAKLQKWPLGQGMQEFKESLPRVVVHLPLGQGVLASAEPSIQ